MWDFMMLTSGINNKHYKRRNCDYSKSLNRNDKITMVKIIARIAISRRLISRPKRINFDQSY